MQGDPSKSISSNLCYALKQLWMFRREAALLRYHHLVELIKRYELDDDQQKAKIVKQIKRAETLAKNHRILKRHTDNNKAGCVTYVKVPYNPSADKNDEKTEWQEVHDIEGMEAAIIEEGKEHFAQAEGTPFTTKPLLEFFQYNGLSTEALAFLDEDPSVDKYAKLLLQHIQAQ